MDRKVFNDFVFLSVIPPFPQLFQCRSLFGRKWPILSGNDRGNSAQRVKQNYAIKHHTDRKKGAKVKKLTKTQTWNPLTTFRILFFDYSDSTSVLQSSDVLQPPVASPLLYMKYFHFEGSLRTNYPRTILEKQKKVETNIKFEV